MRIIAVDARASDREMLTQAIAEACPNAEIFAFAKSSDALEHAARSPCDVAFLDTGLRGMGGVELAKRLMAICPGVNIIFVSNREEYALDAMSMHASGYVIKPVTKDKVLSEVKDLRYTVSRDDMKLLEVNCFGDFEVYDVLGRPVYFKRLKAKEAFAYLVHRQGASCTVREIAAALFEDAPYDFKQQNYMQQIIFSMMQSLKSVNADKVVNKQYNSLSLDVSRVNCDFYRFCQQPIDARDNFRGEYMSQYGWAEHMNRYLEMQISRR